jgi:hypothetical protein
MPLFAPARLRMPTLLAATALGLAAACPDEGETDSTAASEADTGEDPECMIAQRPSCEAADGCMWSPQIDLCVIDCEPFDDAEACEDAEFCEWSEDHCEHHAV